MIYFFILKTSQPEWLWTVRWNEKCFWVIIVPQKPHTSTDTVICLWPIYSIRISSRSISSGKKGSKCIKRLLSVVSSPTWQHPWQTHKEKGPASTDRWTWNPPPETLFLFHESLLSLYFNFYLFHIKSHSLSKTKLSKCLQLRENVAW